MTNELITWLRQVANEFQEGCLPGPTTPQRLREAADYIEKLEAAGRDAVVELSYLIDQVQARETGSVCKAHRNLRDALATTRPQSPEPDHEQ